MPLQFATFGVVIGTTLMALSLGGSYGNPATVTKHFDSGSLAEVNRLHALGKTAFSDGRYQDAREAFWAAASIAMKAGIPRDAAMNWSNAGYSEVLAMRYRSALEDLTRARRTAEISREMVPLIFSLANLTSLYLQMGAPEEALNLSQGALTGPAGHADARMRGKLLFQEAQALTMLNRFDEAEPIFRQALEQLEDSGDLESLARDWTGLGLYYLQFGRYSEAERALSESLRLVRTHQLKASANVLTQLGILRGKQGNRANAEYLFQEALDAHETVTPRWLTYYERGRFRLETGNPQAALEDFREARRLAVIMRAEIVPADQDRIAVEGRVSKIFEGLVTAGNRLELATKGRLALAAETFDVAEQDRLWSLRALVPEPNDWRSRLTPRYWELLARFQSVESSLIAEPTPALAKRAVDLQTELHQAEAAAGEGNESTRSSLPSRHVREILDPDSILLSFSITGTGSWLWMIDQRGTRVFELPPRDQLRREVADFTGALQDGEDSGPSGRRLYRSLFGALPASVLDHKRWFLEPDGPLHDLPFAALPADGAFLVQRVALESIPGALLMERGSIGAGGAFVGVGDPVFNRADSRYRAGVAGRNAVGENTATPLPRLPNTAEEVEACSKAWGSGPPTLLTGSGANVESVEAALSQSPAVIHFATHVVSAPGEFGSGLIALSLDGNGALGLLGPKSISARRVPGSLVVMNGCHSAQGQALPGSGLMGLTRAWIGAGASAVLAARWDVPDRSGQSLMVNFYRALREKNPAAALREAQLAALRAGGEESQPLRWAGYFLLSRI